MKIFIVEDDQKIRDELCVFLENNGFKCIISEDFKNMIEHILTACPDLVLLDINLPHIDGYHICKEVRKVSDVPIIVITSQNTDMDELMSISFGADDFVTKPFNTQVLLARINNLFKRSKKELRHLIVGSVKLNLSDSTISKLEKSVELTKNEVRIMDVLMSHQGEIVSRDDIMEALWQSNEFVDDNTLTVNINRLRKKLESIDIVDFLKTKRGQGYII